MIYAVILDKKDNYSSWGDLSNEEVTISLKSDMNDLPYCDAIIISDSFNERPIEENLAEIKKWQVSNAYLVLRLSVSIALKGRNTLLKMALMMLYKCRYAGN